MKNKKKKQVAYKNTNNNKAKNKNYKKKNNQYVPSIQSDLEKTQKYNLKNVKGKAKKEKKSKKKHPKLRLFIKIVLILFVLSILIIGGIFAGYISGFFGDDFMLTEEELKVSNLNTEIYDVNGVLIQTLSGDESRKWIDIGDMAPYLPEAFVAIEDERFYEHQGVDIKRTIAATAKYILSKVGIGSSSYGGSTITQQLVKNLTKENEKEATRKIKEMARAYNLEKKLSKQQILELYLNLIFLGGQSYGVEMGSQYYFSKSAKDLSLAECAFLAGINNAPSIYEPFSEEQDEIDFIKNRTKTVLGKMKELGKINSEEEYNAAVEEVNNGLAFKKGDAIQNVYSYHTDAAIDQILKQLAEENPDWSDVRVKQYLYGGGLKIYTTQNSYVQSVVEIEMAKPEYQKPSREIDGAVSQAAMVIIDHGCGYVIAAVGGTGVKTVSRGYNFATMEPKQTGSSMKPISVIAPAIQNGVITAGSVYDDVLTKFPGNSYGWPKNYDGRYYGLSTVRQQIEISHNIVPVRILNEMGIDKSIEFMRSVGISTLNEKDEKSLAIALGGLDVGITPLEMAGAYAAIANDGEYITPTFYTKVEDSEGKVVLEPKQERRRVMSEENAYIVKSILTQPVISGTATNCRIPGMDVGAKTGTTDGDKDRWLCGFTPYCTGVVWFGYKYSETVYGFNGANPAGRIWASVMKTTHESLPNAKFEKPNNITYSTICKDSGLIATDLCSQDQRGSRVYTEVYVKGTTPSQRCNCHVQLRVCGTEGNYKLANEYCPDAKDVVFITRENSENNTEWQRAMDAEYMAPTETCTEHQKPPEPKPTPANNTTKNTTTKANTTNQTGKNTTTKANTTSNTAVTNTTTNEITNTTTNAITNSATTDPATKTGEEQTTNKPTETKPDTKESSTSADTKKDEETSKPDETKETSKPKEETTSTTETPDVTSLLTNNTKSE
ncbi:MAG: transglycosylase domain-containing protein [Clostridia bacterium]|nr:transglycosylase domain-containing protein [Clostridia bacterium]